MPEEAEKIICGRSEKEIKKFYFKGELQKLINEIEINGSFSESDAKELGEYLQSLKDKEKTNVEALAKFFDGVIVETEPKPPTTDELYSERADFAEWRKTVDDARKTLNKIKKIANESAYNGGYVVVSKVKQDGTSITEKKIVSKDDFSGWALNIETLKRWIGEDAVYREQLYNKAICDIIDKQGVSRAEAENRAKVTSYYADYKNTRNEYDNLTEIALICKKKSGYDQ